MNNLLRVFILFFFISFTSCQKEDNALPQQQMKIEKGDQNFPVFQKNFPELYKNLNSQFLQEINSTTKSGSPDGFSIPVMNGKKVIGRYIGLANEVNAIYVDFSNYKSYFTVYNVNDPNTFEIFDTKLNTSTGNYEAVITDKGFWCGAACAVGAIAIAASDGPLPLMDALAVTYSIACLAACVEADQAD